MSRIGGEECLVPEDKRPDHPSGTDRQQLEQLEQFRAFHQGESIHVAVASESVPAGVDTEDDLRQVRRHFTDAI
jgi:CMP-2-keto-3-deoxyoctulosonic acid synthetase